LESWLKKQTERVARGMRSDRLTSVGRSAPPPPGAVIERLVGPSGRIVVLDCETTGLTSRDRVVEVALVTLDVTGSVVDRWESLINPRRDVGPTRIHGIRGSDVAHAPEFGDVAGDIAFRLHGAILAAHNLPFDLRMLTGEFTRLAVDFDPGSGIDTLRVTRARLEDACRRYGIEIGDAHRALADAEATAKLLTRVVTRIDERVSPVLFRRQLHVSGRSVPRAHAGGAVERRKGAPMSGADTPTPFDDALEERAEVVAYLDLLARSLENLHLDHEENLELEELATVAGLSPSERERVHLRHVEQLIDRLLADGEVSSEDYDALVRVAAALGVDQDIVHRRTRGARTGREALELRLGMRLCLTGDPEGISKEDLERRLVQAGFVVDPAVTKRTDLLVAADPSSQSSKAEKARRYGIPIVPAASMRDAVPGSQVDAVVLEVGRLMAHVCETCGATWSEPTRDARKRTRCTSCRG
jgi:DNA polymerase-3 subunit epsilon